MMFVSRQPKSWVDRPHIFLVEWQTASVVFLLTWVHQILSLGILLAANAGKIVDFPDPVSALMIKNLQALSLVRNSSLTTHAGNIDGVLSEVSCGDVFTKEGSKWYVFTPERSIRTVSLLRSASFILLTRAQALFWSPVRIPWHSKSISLCFGILVWQTCDCNCDVLLSRKWHFFLFNWRICCHINWNFWWGRSGTPWWLGLLFSLCLGSSWWRWCWWWWWWWHLFMLKYLHLRLSYCLFLTAYQRRLLSWLSRYLLVLHALLSLSGS